MISSSIEALPIRRCLHQSTQRRGRCRAAGGGPPPPALLPQTLEGQQRDLRGHSGQRQTRHGLPCDGIRCVDGVDEHDFVRRPVPSQAEPQQRRWRRQRSLQELSGPCRTLTQLARRHKLLSNVCPKMTRSASDTEGLPVWTIREASRQTGVEPATLRKWEGRYGVPAPQRTPGGYRVYGRRDIIEIRSLARRCAKGLRARQAAYVVLRERVTAAGSSSEPGDLPAMRRRLEEACLMFDDEAVAVVLKQASIVCRGLDILRALVIPVVATVAAGHHAGAITVSQEHFASQLARRIGAGLLAATTPAATRPAVLLACAPGEQHELGLLWLACELGQRGFHVTYLGPAVPVESFLAAADSLDVPIGVISATIRSSLEEWRPHLAGLKQRGRLTIVWAGPAAPLAARWPGYVARDIREGIKRVLRLS
jgi:MerR family transcriptional regulator, light-induced transcriptional regulator